MKVNDTKPLDEMSAEEQIVSTLASYKREADEARRERLRLNDRNFDFYHLKQDYSHKKAGQSQEFLAKQALAVEQITSFIHQGLVDLGDWFSVDPAPGNNDPLFTRTEARAVLERQLRKAGFFTHIQDALKTGLLSALMIAKVGGRHVERARYVSMSEGEGENRKNVLRRQKKKAWELRIDLVRFQDYYRDPTGGGLYELQDIEMDLWELKALAEASPKVYDLSQIDALVSSFTDEEQLQKDRETGHTPTDRGFRKRVVLTEFWGTILDRDGNIMHENVVAAVANDRFLVRPPQANPLWHNRSPFVVSPIVRVPHSTNHKALMDEPTALNHALNELFNLILDAGLMSVFGVRQVREHWLDNADEIAKGLGPGAVLKANAQCPPGQKVLETVSSGTLSQEALNVYNLTNGEFQAAALTNDLRLGVLPSRNVKATEVVEASQSITSVFTGVAKTIENDYIRPLLELAWLTIAQHTDDLDDAELEALLGKDRAKKLANVSAQERFQRVVDGHDFNVFGITQTLNKVKDFRKLTSMLQTISGSEVLTEEFTKRFDFAKLLDEIMNSLDINTDKIRLGEMDEALTTLGRERGGGEGVASGGSVPGPDHMSQIPRVDRAGGSPEGGLPPVPRTEFPRIGGGHGGAGV